MSFADARKANFYNVILNTAHFAEVVTFRRHGQDDKQITVVCTPTQNERNDQSASYIEEKVETLQVRVGRDETEAKGGIATPTIGDGILRAPGGILDPRIYSFQGRIEESTPHSWTLIFTRRVPELVGGRR
jgi:hypothetical protein